MLPEVCQAKHHPAAAANKTLVGQWFASLENSDSLHTVEKIVYTAHRLTEYIGGMILPVGNKPGFYCEFAL